MMWLGINVYADEYDGLDFDYGSVLVQLKPQITDAVSMCSDPFEELNISGAKCIFGDDTSSISLFSDKTEPIIYVLDLENPSRENVIDTIEKLKAMPNIEYAEPNYNVYEFSEPNDTYYQNGKQAVLDLIGAKKLWDFDIDCSDVAVGVMDSGIQTNHEDLIDNIWVNTREIVGDGIDNDGNGYIDDIYGWNCGDSNGDVSYVSNHGVHVAGIVTYPSQNDWYETVKLNYGVDYMHGGACHFNTIPNTWEKMLEILLFWADKGVDGFRYDMAEMVPVEFWNWVIPQVKKVRDVIFIAEVYNPDEYRNYIYTGHFDYLYDKVGLYDTVRAVMCGQAPASNISHCWQSLEGIQKNMLNFLENHDEQRVASDFFAGDARPGIPGMIVSAAMNTNPVMIYSGQELGERGMDAEGFSGRDGRTTIFDYWSVGVLQNWNNNGLFDGAKLTPAERSLREMYAKLLNVVRSEPVIVEGAFYDLMYANSGNPYFNPNRQYAFLRKWKNEVLLVVVNFDRADQCVWVNIPVEAFKALDFEDNKPAELTDLLTGETTISTLTDAYPYQVKLPAYSGKMLKFSFLHK